MQATHRDGVVYLAGAYWPFGAKEWEPEHATTMIDVNLTGLVRVMGEVVPDMVKRDAGHIVITSSLTAYRGLPKSIGYTASKAGTLSLAECMHADLRKSMRMDAGSGPAPRELARATSASAAASASSSSSYCNKSEKSEPKKAVECNGTWAALGRSGKMLTSFSEKIFVIPFEFSQGIRILARPSSKTATKI